MYPTICTKCQKYLFIYFPHPCYKFWLEISILVKIVYIISITTVYKTYVGFASSHHYIESLW